MPDSMPINHSFVIQEADLMKEAELEGLTHPYGSLELSALYRKIAEYLITSDTILFHSSAVEIKGHAYLFAAPSGTGKSTHVRLLRKYLGEENVQYINDDKPLIHISPKEAIVYGTPWNGKERLSNNISAPLQGIALLQRSKTNHIEKANKEEAYPLLLRQIHRSSDKENLLHTLALVDTMLQYVNVYNLYVNMELDAAKASYQGMIQEGERE